MSPLLRFGRFNAVGVLGIGVQLTVLWVLVDALRVGYLPATMIAVGAAVAHNFLWHLRWTWADRPRDAAAAREAFARFVLANGVVSLAGNVGLMALLVSGFGLPPVVSNVIAITTCGLLNFFLGDRVVFKQVSRFRGSGGSGVPRSEVQGSLS